MDDPQVPLPRETAAPGDPEIARAAAPLRILAGALAASVVVYAGIGWFLAVEAVRAGFEPAGLPPPVATALAVGGVALLLVAPLAERGLRSGGARAEPEEALGRFRTATIAGFALREAAAILGLVIAATTGELFWCWILSAAALVTMVAAWPSRERLERVARGAALPS